MSVYNFKKQLPGILRDFERRRDEDTFGSSTAPSQDTPPSFDHGDEESESDDDVICRETSDDDEDKSA